MTRKLIYSAIVAAVMAGASPIHAQADEIMYMYVYYENGQEVGQAFDICSGTGQIFYQQLTWGYRTQIFDALPQVICRDGVMVPIT